MHSSRSWHWDTHRLRETLLWGWATILYQMQHLPFWVPPDLRQFFLSTKLQDGWGAILSLLPSLVLMLVQDHHPGALHLWVLCCPHGCCHMISTWVLVSGQNHPLCWNCYPSGERGFNSSSSFFPFWALNPLDQTDIFVPPVSTTSSSTDEATVSRSSTPITDDYKEYQELMKRLANSEDPDCISAR